MSSCSLLLGTQIFLRHWGGCLPLPVKPSQLRFAAPTEGILYRLLLRPKGANKQCATELLMTLAATLEDLFAKR